LSINYSAKLIRLSDCIYSLSSGKKNKQTDKAVLYCGEISVHFIEHVIAQYSIYNDQEKKKTQHI